MIRLAPAGSVHIELLNNYNYIAAVAEETWFDDQEMAKRIAEMIGDKKSHYSIQVALKNAELLTEYLQEKLEASFPQPTVYLSDSDWNILTSIDKATEMVKLKIKKQEERDPWFNLEKRYSIGQVAEGIVDGSKEGIGVFVKIEPEVVGLVHHSKLSNSNYIQSVKKGETISVIIDEIKETRRRIALRPAI